MSLDSQDYRSSGEGKIFGVGWSGKAAWRRKRRAGHRGQASLSHPQHRLSTRPLVYNGHLSSTNLCPQVSSCQVGGGTRPSQKARGSPRGWSSPAPAASRTMGTGLRSQSLRGPRPSYSKLQEPWGRPLAGRLRRALSLRQEREKSRSSDGGPERLDAPGQEQLPGSLGDTEQLIQAQQEGSQRWLRQYQQVWLRVGGWRSARGEGEVPRRGTQGSKGSEAEMYGAVDQKDNRAVWGRGWRERDPRTVFQGGLKAFGIYPIGTGESGKVLGQVGDMVRAVPR